MTGRYTEVGRTDRWMHGKIMLLSHNFTRRGSDVAVLVEFRLVV